MLYRYTRTLVIDLGTSEENYTDRVIDVHYYDTSINKKYRYIYLLYTYFYLFVL